MIGGKQGPVPGAATDGTTGGSMPLEGCAGRDDREGLPRRGEIGALDVSLPPDLGRALRAAASRLGETPRRLALDILDTVIGQDLLGAVLDRG